MGADAVCSQEILALRAARVRSEAALVVQAQRWLFCGCVSLDPLIYVPLSPALMPRFCRLVVFFVISLAGYGWIRSAGVPVGDRLPLNLLEAAAYEMCILGSGVFAARYIIVAGKLGMPQAPAPEVSQAEQVAAVQEKV